MCKVGEHRGDLVVVSEGGYERADRVGIAEVVEKFELVEDTARTAGDVYLLDGYKAGSVFLRGRRLV